MQVIETDVLVVGGGTAGFGAAVAAGRFGLKVTLIEASNKIGGVMAFCPGMPWGAAFPAGKIIGGILEELWQQLTSMSPPAAERRPCTLENFGPEILYDHDVATTEMFDMLEKAGVNVRLNSLALEPSVDHGRVTSVECCDQSGLFSVRPGIVIDCSGDGGIAVKSGVPFTLGDGKGNMMGVTISFHMIGADWNKVFTGSDPYFTEFAAKGIADGRIHPDLAKLYLMKGFHRDTVFCNSVVIRGVDGTDPVAVGRATQEGRRRCMQLAKYLRDEVPGFESARPAFLGPTAGVRESRKLEGMYRVTGEDLARATKFADGIVCCDNPVDDVMRSDSSMTHDAIVDKGAYYTIPFRSLVPKEIANLMFAGRNICADPVAFASVRGMPQCMAMGQATGTAAHLALRDGVAVQAVDAGELVSSLTAQGVRGLGNTNLADK